MCYRPIRRLETSRREAAIAARSQNTEEFRVIAFASYDRANIRLVKGILEASFDPRPRHPCLVDKVSEWKVSPLALEAVHSQKYFGEIVIRI